MSWIARSAVAMAAAVVTALGAYAAGGAARADTTRALGPGLVTVDVHIHYSHFSFSTLRVHTGTTVRFLVHNDDPIHHELVVGDASVHARHEHGTESTHPPIPGEVSVAPNDIGETFYVFDQPGRFMFACHLPGHFAYGMHGWVVVDGS